MMEMKARTWDQVRADADLDETLVADARGERIAARRAYRLAEIRKQHGDTQADIADRMHVSQPRVSEIESGDLSASQMGTLTAYVEALGGELKLVADFGDEQLVVG